MEGTGAPQGPHPGYRLRVLGGESWSQLRNRVHVSAAGRPDPKMGSVQAPRRVPLTRAGQGRLDRRLYALGRAGLDSRGVIAKLAQQGSTGGQVPQGGAPP